MTHIIYSKIIQRLSNLNLLLSIKESIGELFTLAQGTLDNLEVVDVA